MIAEWESNDRLPFRCELFRSVRPWWNEIASDEGTFGCWRGDSRPLGIVRDSSPQRRRLRYGDAQFDLAATASVTYERQRFLARPPALDCFPPRPISRPKPRCFMRCFLLCGSKPVGDFRDFIFIDLGSGKGRALLMASDYPFRRIVGVELLPQLHRAAQDNLTKYRSETQQCFCRAVDLR